MAISEGRFGNQILQLAGALTAAHAGERVLLIGFPEIPRRWGQPHVFIIGRNSATNRMIRILLTVVRRTMELLTKWRIFTEVDVDHVSKSFIRKKGLLKPVSFITETFMQVGGLAKPHWIQSVYEAAREIDEKKLLEGRYNFIHIRRGDYMHWPSSEHPAELPTSWFEGALEQLRAKSPDSQIVVLSDDIEWARQQSFLAGTLIPELTAIESWVMMCEADGGVLSASSLSFSASVVAHQRSLRSDLFYAPNYWIGWPQKKWYPISIQSPHLTYLDVD